MGHQAALVPHRGPLSHETFLDRHASIRDRHRLRARRLHVAGPEVFPVLPRRLLAAGLQLSDSRHRRRRFLSARHETRRTSRLRRRPQYFLPPRVPLRPRWARLPSRHVDDLHRQRHASLVARLRPPRRRVSRRRRLPCLRPAETCQRRCHRQRTKPCQRVLRRLCPLPAQARHSHRPRDATPLPSRGVAGPQTPFALHAR